MKKKAMSVRERVLQSLNDQAAHKIARLEAMIARLQDEREADALEISFLHQRVLKYECKMKGNY
jgi:hypothetical protein